MPTLTLQLNHQPSAERAAEIAQRLTALTATLLDGGGHPGHAS
jgi:phenylpyruvate tautomerase PptA (4-oxalocrotonate tautomerase family)